MAGLMGLRSLLRKPTLLAYSHRLVSSTSKKNSETVSPTVEQCATSAVKKNKNWMSYGFEEANKDADRATMHSLFFLSITLCLMGGGFVFLYAPDYNLSNWSVREAFLELRRREAKGLPLIDPNFIDVNSIDLPSDEELGDTDIIV